MAAAVVSEPSPPQLMDRTSSRRNSESSTADGPDNRSSSSPSKQLDLQTQPSLKSEEYRQLFRLPPDEVLIQDFNCALQENFLLQGHMYVFDHYICFYSNLFGFETKKMIHFHEVSSVERAKAAGIFPTAIEIVAEEKKYFFTSFLSRDEAYKLIIDGWLQHRKGPKTVINQQELNSGISTPENGSAICERAESSSSRLLVNDLDLVERDKNVPVAEESVNDEAETEIPCRTEASVEEEVQIVQPNECSPSQNSSLLWKEEDSNAPKIPEGCTMVAESKFPIKVEEFFNMFFSDAAAGFQESFYKKCGDKEFRSTSWRPHEEYGHTRDVSFQHPIKIYFGARFGICQEMQKYKVYKNSHLVLETSQEISDVPYADYFRVEGRWDVERLVSGSKEGCILRVYSNVAFSKKTMWRGKIVQSTVEECREVSATWLQLAHELLKKKNIEQEAGIQAANAISNNQLNLESLVKVEENTLNLLETNNIQTDQVVLNQQVINNQQVRLSRSPSSLIDSIVKLGSTFRGQSRFSLHLIIAMAIILLLMQISILVLLSRPQQIHVVPGGGDYTNVIYRRSEKGTERAALLDKQIDHMKEEMLMIENMLDKMTQQHALLKDKLEDLEFHRKRQI